MADKSTEQRVKDIIVEQLGVNADQVTPEAKFIEDLGADSLDTVELVMALEEEFGHEIPDEEAEKLQSVGDVIKYIDESRQKNSSGRVYHLAIAGNGTLKLASSSDLFAATAANEQGAVGDDRQLAQLRATARARRSG